MTLPPWGSAPQSGNQCDRATHCGAVLSVHLPAVRSSMRFQDGKQTSASWSDSIIAVYVCAL